MQTATEIEAQIRTRADSDDSFRAKLLQDPRSAIEEVTGMTVPESFHIHVHEESANDFHLVLPPSGGRLSDQELRDASGGYAAAGDSW